VAGHCSLWRVFCGHSGRDYAGQSSQNVANLTLELFWRERGGKFEHNFFKTYFGAELPIFIFDVFCISFHLSQILTIKICNDCDL